SAPMFAPRPDTGGLFVDHALQKLQGRFNGPGIEGPEAMMESLEMRPARRNALAAGVTETAGGAMLAAGLATPLASSALIGVMLTAIRKVHDRNSTRLDASHAAIPCRGFCGDNMDKPRGG